MTQIRLSFGSRAPINEIIAHGMRIVRAALHALETEVSAPTLFDPLDMSIAELPEARHAS